MLTWSGCCYVVGLAAVVAGLATSKARAQRRRAITGGGLVVLVVTLVARIFTGGEGSRITMHARTGESARLIDRLIDEGDLALTGTRALVTVGLIDGRDAPELVPAMGVAYARMRAEEHDMPSPVLATYLGLQSPVASDTLVVETARPPRAALIFLHGFTGNFTLPCWQLAQAVRDLDVLTVCPSASYRGDWWTAGGEATLARTVAYLHRRGIRHIHLAGLSNGGVGASRLVARMPGLFEGLIVISGSDPEAPVVTGLPVLVVQGRHDTMMPASVATAYAARTGARYVDLDAGHFAMLVRGEETGRAIHAWMEERLAEGM